MSNDALTETVDIQPCMHSNEVFIINFLFPEHMQEFDHNIFVIRINS